MNALAPESYREIMDNLPCLVMRLVYADSFWKATFVNRAVERYGYSREEFTNGKLTWNDLLHPDDRVVNLTLSDQYMKNGIDDFRLQYRIRTREGASIYITEFSHVNRGPDGKQTSIDSLMLENLQANNSGDPRFDEAMKRNLALNDILLTINDAKTEPEKAIQYILDRAGAILDCSRALLFQDSPDHKTCKVVYEWLNNGISSIKELDYAVTYSTEMPEIYVALQDTGVLLVNAGEIPENCKEEFEAEGLLSSAIFAVYQYGDHYGFVCFDDCIIARRWDSETANFLKVVANLLSSVVMNLQSAKYMESYEEKIRSMAFKDYLTGLPNQFTFDSDFGDMVVDAATEGKPAYALMLSLGDVLDTRKRVGLKAANDLIGRIAEAVSAMLKDTVGERGTLYRIAGTVFAVLVKPGPGEPVRAFMDAVRSCSREKPECGLGVAAMPFGVKNRSLDDVVQRLDAAVVEGYSRTETPFEFIETEA